MEPDLVNEGGDEEIDGEASIIKGGAEDFEEGIQNAISRVKAEEEAFKNAPSEIQETTIGKLIETLKGPDETSDDQGDKDLIQVDETSSSSSGDEGNNNAPPKLDKEDEKGDEEGDECNTHQISLERIKKLYLGP